MKKASLLIITLLLLTYSCKKEEPQTPETYVKTSLAEDLQQIITNEKIDVLAKCCVSCTCSQSMGWGKDYAFIGDNFVRIQSITYNLNLLLYTKVETITNSNQTEKRLILYFKD